MYTRAGHAPHRRLQRGHPDDREERLARGAHHRDRGQSDGGSSSSSSSSSSERRSSSSSSNNSSSIMISAGIAVSIIEMTIISMFIIISMPRAYWGMLQEANFRARECRQVYPFS